MRLFASITLPKRHAARCATVIVCLFFIAGAFGSGKPKKCNSPTIILLGDLVGPFLVAGEEIQKVLDSKSAMMSLDDFRRGCSLNAGQRYVGVGPTAARYLALNASEDIDVAFCMLPSAERAGLGQRQSLVGVTTGVATHEQLALIRETLPGAKRIGMLYRSSSAASNEALESMRGGMDSMFELLLVDLDTESNVSKGIDKLMRMQPDVIWTFPDPAVYGSASVRALLIASIRTKTPVFGFSSGMVRAGALFGLDIDPRSQGQQLAERLNSGAGDGVHIETAKMRPVINLIVAKKIGIEFSTKVKRDAVKTFK